MSSLQLCEECNVWGVVVPGSSDTTCAHCTAAELKDRVGDKRASSGRVRILKRRLIKPALPLAKSLDDGKIFGSVTLPIRWPGPTSSKSEARRRIDAALNSTGVIEKMSRQRVDLLVDFIRGDLLDLVCPGAKQRRADKHSDGPVFPSWAQVTTDSRRRVDDALTSTEVVEKMSKERVDMFADYIRGDLLDIVSRTLKATS